MKRLLFLLPALMSVGCNKGGDSGDTSITFGPYKESHFLLSFVTPDDNRMYYTPYHDGNTAFYYLSSDSNIGYLCYRSDDREQYEYLCAYYGDTTYPKRNRYYYSSGNGIYLYQDLQILSVAIGLENDDERLDVTDMCYFCTTTPRPYIDSGYTDEYDWRNRPEIFVSYDIRTYNSYYGEYHPVCKPLRECQPSDFELVSLPTNGGSFGFGALVIPDVSKLPLPEGATIDRMKAYVRLYLPSWGEERIAKEYIVRTSEGNIAPF